MRQLLSYDRRKEKNLVAKLVSQFVELLRCSLVLVNSEPCFKSKDFFELSFFRTLFLVAHDLALDFVVVVPLVLQFFSFSLLLCLSQRFFRGRSV